MINHNHHTILKGTTANLNREMEALRVERPGRNPTALACSRSGKPAREHHNLASVVESLPEHLHHTPTDLCRSRHSREMVEQRSHFPKPTMPGRVCPTTHRQRRCLPRSGRRIPVWHCRQWGSKAHGSQERCHTGNMGLRARPTGNSSQHRATRCTGRTGRRHGRCPRPVRQGCLRVTGKQRERIAADHHQDKSLTRSTI